MSKIINGEVEPVAGLKWRGKITGLDCEIPLSAVSWNSSVYAKLATRSLTGIPKYKSPPVVPDGFNAYDACLMADASYHISRGTQPPTVIKSILSGKEWRLVETNDQVLLYACFESSTEMYSAFCVAIRGTASANDGMTDSTIPFGQLRSTPRWKNNKKTIEEWKARWVGPNWWGTAHSLGGALIDLAVESKLVSFAYAFNPAVDPANYFSGLNTLRIFQRLDWMYNWFGQYCDNVFVYTNPNITFWQMTVGNIPILRLPQQVEFHLLDKALGDFGMVFKSGSGRKHRGGLKRHEVHEIFENPEVKSTLVKAYADPTKNNTLKAYNKLLETALQYCSQAELKKLVELSNNITPPMIFGKFDASYSALEGFIMSLINRNPAPPVAPPPPSSVTSYNSIPAEPIHDSLLERFGQVMVAGRNQSPIIQRRLDEIANQVSKVHMTHMKPKERNKKLKELLDEAEGVLLHGYGRKLRR